jgi:hypothetical protein
MPKFTDPDDAPEWPDEAFDRAEVRHGDEMIKPATGTLTKGPDKNGWLPIDQAPRDGTEIDVWSPGSGRKCDVWWEEKPRVPRGAKPLPEGGWVEEGDMAEWPVDPQPTHFMLKPEPPE